MLITFGVICHAQTSRPDACEAELAKCQALLGAVGAKDETGTASSASKGALIAFYPAAD